MQSKTRDILFFKSISKNNNDIIIIIKDELHSNKNLILS